MKHFLPTLLLCLSPIAVAQQVAPKNIIMIIGDGMGPAYTSAYRYFSDDPKTKEIESTVFDRYLVGSSSTYPATINTVTDSAAGATALATGTKSYNGAISVNVDKKPLMTVLEWAKSQGKKTGVVVTSQVNHATPAAYLAHNESRRNYDEIANSYIDDGIKIDLLLGGGWKYFLREDRNLVDEFKAKGFHYLDKYADLSNLPKEKPVLGLFADVGLPWALDDDNKHRLSAMTKAAVHQIEGDKGFFMLIEASQIDWGGHGNDIAASMAEMDDLAKTLEYLEHYVEHHPDTLVVLTADHSTGGFTIGANGKYQWQPEVLRSMTMSADTIADKIEMITPDLLNTKPLFNFTLTKEDVEQLTNAKANVVKDLATYKALTTAQQKSERKPDSHRTIYKAVTLILDKHSTTGWTSNGHTGVDVPVFSFGKGSSVFNGYQDNTDIAKKIFTYLGK